MKIATVFLIVILGVILLAQANASPGCKHKHHTDLKVEEALHKASLQRNNVSCKQCITIDTYFWTFHGTDADALNPTIEMMQEQFNVLVDKFSDTPFIFRLVSNQIIQNNKYHTEDLGDNSEQITLDFRGGGNQALNAYFGGDGHGSFATTAGITLTEEEFNLGDASFVDISSVPGLPVNQDQSWQGRSLGHTLVHEVGHWMVSSSTSSPSLLSRSI